MDKIIIAYTNAKDRQPFLDWVSELDIIIKRKVIARIDNLKLRHYEDCKNLKGGLFEMQINTGAEYRVYFTEQKGVIIILLYGGTKQRQRKDIEKAREYLKNFEDKKRGIEI